MKNFPQLTSQQVALVRADFKTGEILDAAFSPAVNEIQEVYTIFNSQAEAVEYAKSLINDRPDIECVIQGPNEELLKYLTPENFKTIQ